MIGPVFNKKYLGITLSPLHIGSRAKFANVDLSIARDVDLLPVVTASTLRGCTRAYSHIEYSLMDCDSKGQECPQPHLCSSCAVYGYLSYRGDKRSTSLVMFSPGLMLFTPIQTEHGMIWISSIKRLEDSDIIDQTELASYKKSFNTNKVDFLASVPLMDDLSTSKFRIGSSDFNFKRANAIDTDHWSCSGQLKHIFDRCIVVKEDQYGAVANNLIDVYTSIQIDNKTGTAKPGALYAYEGVPRSSVFYLEIGFLDPKSQGISKFISEKKRMSVNCQVI